MILGDEMVLMDAGAEMHLYASDVTRTWPVTGHFTQPQRELYLLLQEVDIILINHNILILFLDCPSSVYL